MLKTWFDYVNYQTEVFLCCKLLLDNQGIGAFLPHAGDSLHNQLKIRMRSILYRENLFY